MKVMQVTLGLWAGAGGPSRSIAGLTRGLSLLPDMEVCLFDHFLGPSSGNDLGRAKWIKGVWQGNVFDSVRQFQKALDEEKPDIVHFHGIWHPIIHFDCCACRRLGIPYVIAPRGSLDAWSLKQKWLKKKIALWLYQMRDLRHAAALHVTADMEADYCRAMGYRGKFIISPNGVNLPATLPAWNRRADGKRRMLFLSRMHPKKGIGELIEALRVLREQDAPGAADWECELVYTVFQDEEKRYEQEMKSLVDRYRLSDRVVFTGKLSDADKWLAYRRADCFVLPSHTENFGIVIAEAMYAGLPVITTKNTPWQRIVSVQSGWWIDLRVDELVRALSEMMVLSDVERTEMGARGRQLVESTCSWESACKMMVQGYREVLA